MDNAFFSAPLPELYLGLNFPARFGLLISYYGDTSGSAISSPTSISLKDDLALYWLYFRHKLYFRM